MLRAGFAPNLAAAAGGGYSTVGDIARFADALSKVAFVPGIKYAFGFADARDKNGNGWVGHGGGAPGMNGDLRIYLKSGYVVAVLSNLDPPAAQRISDYLDLRLPIS
jgi:hypothetical protein